MKVIIKSFLFIIFFIPVTMFSEDGNISDSKYKDLKELRDNLITRDSLIDSIWEIIIKTVKNENIPNIKKTEIIEKFIKDFPDKNKYSDKAQLFLSELKKTDSNIRHILDSDSYRTKIEWFALNFSGGNYGLGGGFTLITLRGRYVFWEIARIHAAGYRNIVAANAKTMVGIPFFFDPLNRNELRFSIGLSGGFTNSWSGEEEDFDFDYGSFFNLPIEISYVFHADKYFAFQMGFSVDFPVWYFGGFLPVFNGFIGFRI